ncbi:hypothetical protein AX17_004757, partial [Amanita inopinata Kibby_2008]
MDRYSPLLPTVDEQDMRQREAALAEFLLSHKVAMVPGAHCHMDAGRFRVVFSVKKDYVDVALARIEDALGWVRWPELVKLTINVISYSMFEIIWPRGIPAGFRIVHTPDIASALGAYGHVSLSCMMHDVQFP